MAEQFGFDEIGRDRAAIHGNHALLETGRGRMNGLRNDFLADAAFAFDQYRNASAGGLGGDGERGAKLRGRAYDLLKGERSGHLLRQRSEEHTSELQSLMRTSYAVFC